MTLVQFLNVVHEKMMVYFYSFDQLKNHLTQAVLKLIKVWKGYMLPEEAWIQVLKAYDGIIIQQSALVIADRLDIHL